MTKRIRLTSAVPLLSTADPVRIFQPYLPVWLGCGSPGSLERAARLDYPIAIPVLDGSFRGYAQLPQHYRHARVLADKRPEDSRIAIFCHLQVSEG